jgi:hypothetical protein
MICINEKSDELSYFLFFVPSLDLALHLYISRIPQSVNFNTKETLAGCMLCD